MNSINSILTPILATAVLGLGGMDVVILIDLASFAAAFLVLLFLIPIPQISVRKSIPEEIQGRVYATRNSFQFFTIPVGYFLGGLLVDRLFEPIMAAQKANSLLVRCFGTGKGSGAAFFFAVLWLMGMGVCLLFRRDPHIWILDAGHCRAEEAGLKDLQRFYD